MKKVFEIGGIDTSGKTEQTNAVLSLLQKRGLAVGVASKRLPLDERFPKDFSQRVDWYHNAPVEEIILANLESTVRRDELTFKMDKDIVLEDRGFITIYSSCVAHCMQRTGKGLKESCLFVDKLNQEGGYFSIENAHFLLEFQNPLTMNEVIKKRSPEIVSDIFGKYLGFMDEAIRKQRDSGVIYRLNAEDSIKNTSEYIMHTIQGLI